MRCQRLRGGFVSRATLHIYQIRSFLSPSSNSSAPPPPSSLSLKGVSVLGGAPSLKAICFLGAQMTRLLPRLPVIWATLHVDMVRDDPEHGIVMTIVGVFVFMLGCAWVVINERRHARQHKFRKYAMHKTVDIRDDARWLDRNVPWPTLVCVHGVLHVGDGSPMRDPQIPSIPLVYANGSEMTHREPIIRIKRTVEMYQIVEQRKSVRDGPSEEYSYEYSANWDDKMVALFRNPAAHNDTNFPFFNVSSSVFPTLGNKEIISPNTTVLDYNIKEDGIVRFDVSDDMVRLLEDWYPIVFDAEHGYDNDRVMQSLSAALQSEVMGTAKRRDFVGAAIAAWGRWFPRDNHNPTVDVNPSSHAVVHSIPKEALLPSRTRLHIDDSDPSLLSTVPSGESPRVGDIRVRYWCLLGGELTLLACPQPNLRGTQTSTGSQHKHQEGDAAVTIQHVGLLRPFTFEDFLKSYRHPGGAAPPPSRLADVATMTLPSVARHSLDAVIHLNLWRAGVSEEPKSALAESGVFNQYVIPQFVYELAESWLLKVTPVELSEASRGDVAKSVRDMYQLRAKRDNWATWRHRVYSFGLLQLGLCWGSGLATSLVLPSWHVATGCTIVAAVVWLQTMIVSEVQLRKHAELLFPSSLDL